MLVIRVKNVSQFAFESHVLYISHIEFLSISKIWNEFQMLINLNLCINVLVFTFRGDAIGHLIDLLSLFFLAFFLEIAFYQPKGKITSVNGTQAYNKRSNKRHFLENKLTLFYSCNNLVQSHR